MIASTATRSLAPLLPGLLRAAVESDRRYFELGATIEDLGGAELAWLPSLAHVPAAVVIQRVDPSAVVRDGSDWLAGAERRLVELGAPLARVYLDEAGSPLDGLLAEHGYVRREELAFVASALPAPHPDVRLRRVIGDTGWDDKLRFHQDTPERPDGRDVPAAEWVRLERAKCGPGGMEAFLAEVDGEVAGSIGVVRVDGILRLKNVVAHVAHRRRGVATSMLGHLGALAKHEDRWGVCIFAVAGEAGERLYRAAGFEVAGVQVEWSKPLGTTRRP